MSGGRSHGMRSMYTALLPLPAGWREVELRDFVSRVVGGGTPARGKASFWNGTIPWASVKDVSSADLLLGETEEHITEAGLRGSTANLIDSGIPLICTRMAVGTVVLTTQPTAINQDLKALYPVEGLDTRYFIRVLKSLQPRLEAVAIGSTVKGIRLDQLLGSHVLLPPLPEQRRIAEVLDTVDEAIQQTEALIAKLNEMKQGLLHDLLTRGLDENGELRDPVAHPEQFKDSPLGRIPREWEVAPIGVPVTRAEYGISASLDDDEGIPVLRMNNLRDGEVVLDDLKYSRSREAQNLPLQPRDVLFNRTNSIDHVGRTSIWRGQIQKASFASYLVRLVCDQAKLLPEYLTLWMNHPATQLRIRRFATPGVHQVNINPTNLRKSPIAYSSRIEEQWAITRAMELHEARIQTEEAQRGKLQLLKQALMQDLLTGRVRVPVPES